MVQKLASWSSLDDRMVAWAKSHGIDTLYSYSIDRTVNESGKLTLVIGFDPDVLEEKEAADNG